MIKAKYFVYLLKSETSNRVYVGFTVDIVRRLKSHNGLISWGQTKKTRIGRPWELIMYITGFEYERTALQLEYMIQHPPKYLRKRGGGIKRTMMIMKSLLKQERICSTAPPNSELKLMKVFSKREYLDIWNSI